MSATDLREAIEVVRLTMGEDAAVEIDRSLSFHFECRKAGLDDGRNYLTWRENISVLGITGLHHYNWGPANNVWLGWFVVHPDQQGRGIGQALFEAAESLALKSGFTRLLIETDDAPGFEKAHQFYESRGYDRAGQIEDYFPGQIDLLIYAKSLVD